MSAATHCQGCGTELPPPGDFNHRQKWCSNRCRKASYGDPCIDCGKRTSFGAEQARVPEPRCVACARIHRFAPFRRQVEQMWADGFSARAIAQAVGWNAKQPGCLISGLRAHGYNLPHRNLGSARYQAVHGTESMARARSGKAA